MIIHINEHPVIATTGMTVLEAARRAGIEIPTLCHRDGLPPNTSCFLCVVRIVGQDGLRPACAVEIEENMQIYTESPEIEAARRTALELLFSDHAGMCEGPCAAACPAHGDVSAMMARVVQGDVAGALEAIRRNLVFPAILGHVCQGYCESACVRRERDEALSIRAIHRFLGEQALAAGDPWPPPRAERTGRRVAIVGAGPAGLAAAFRLTGGGHACEIFDAAESPGGLLRRMPPGLVSQEIVEAEIAAVMDLGASFRGAWRLGEQGSLDDLRKDFDAVVVAVGASSAPADSDREVDLDLARKQGLRVTHRGVEADRQTQQTNIENVFIAGEFHMGRANVVRSVASGLRAADAISRHLRGEPLHRMGRPLFFRQKDATESEQCLLHGDGEPAPRVEAGPRGFTPDEALGEARRCLQCTCESAHDCRLREYGSAYGARPHRFSGERRTLSPDNGHPDVVYEPGKCILCGLCLAVAHEEGAAVGLAFSGRGFPTRVVGAMGAEMSAALDKAARRCAEVCPTAAFYLKEKD